MRKAQLVLFIFLRKLGAVGFLLQAKSSLLKEIQHKVWVYNLMLGLSAAPVLSAAEAGA